MPEEKLRPLLGSEAHRLAELAKGIDKRQVAPENKPRSISSETTFASDLSDFDALAACAEDLCLKVTQQLKVKDYHAKKVVLKLKFFNHRLITRSQMLSSPSQMRHDIFPLICALLKKETGSGQRYRLLGVGVELSDAADTMHPSPTFFDISDLSKIKNSRLEKAVDSVHERMGVKSLRSGRHLRPVQKDRDRNIQKEKE